MKIYFSHPIRGSKGGAATDEDMARNNDLAIEEAGRWRDFFHPRADIYVPAEHDEFIILAFRNEILTEAEILAVDCMILGKCDLLLVFNEDCVSGGMQVEIDHARTLNIPILYTHGQDE